MNKKGFISITIVYSFFMVFLALLIFIVNNLYNNRILLGSIKNDIKDEINNDNFARYLLKNEKDNIKLSLDESVKIYNPYVYKGEEPNNWVCFDSDESSCSEESLYRIVGILNYQVKLMKASNIKPIENDGTAFREFPLIKYAENYKFDNYSNSYVYDYLNKFYLSTPSDSETDYFLYNNQEYQNMIDNHEWYLFVGNLDSGEFLNDSVDTEHTISNFKVGLPYISDYENNKDWIDNSYVNDNNIWWFITQNLESNNYYMNGNVISYKDLYWTNPDGDVIFNTSGVRPCFYLKESVKVKSGDGSHDNPYRLGA